MRTDSHPALKRADAADRIERALCYLRSAIDDAASLGKWSDVRAITDAQDNLAPARTLSGARQALAVSWGCPDHVRHRALSILRNA